MKTDCDIKTLYIKTKNKTRKIYTYVSEDCELKKKHDGILAFLKENFIESKFSKAYVSRQSIYTNAKAHMYNDFFLMLDIKDFFGSINHKRLIEKMFYELNRIESNAITRTECANIVEACSVNNVGIPLGFITSPILSNIYLKEFDGVLYGELKGLNLENMIYTRYADDLCISFKKDSEECADIDGIFAKITEIASTVLKRYGLRLNEKKTRDYSLENTNHVKITGVNVTKNSENYRRLTIGNSIKNKLFWDAIACYQQNTREHREVYRIKGMLSFVLSVEKKDYDKCYSIKMVEILRRLGFSNLKELIDSLKA